VFGAANRIQHAGHGFITIVQGGDLVAGREAEAGDAVERLGKLLVFAFLGAVRQEGQGAVWHRITPRLMDAAAVLFASPTEDIDAEKDIEQRSGQR
jgi:hypothetical protein